MRKSFSALLLLALLVSACAPAVTATPAAQPAATETSQPTPAPLAPLYDIPAAAWSRGMGVPYEDAGKPAVNYTMIDDGEWAGVPLGGLGSGSIGRTYRGDFARWNMDLGTHQFESIPANQFSVYVSQNGETQAHVLSPESAGAPNGWNQDMPDGAATYYGLFPKAWYVYQWDVLPVQLEQMQFSPVIPGNYQESSYPVGVFEWKMNNPTDQPMTVSIMFSWQNLVGHAWGTDAMGGNSNEVIEQDGLTGIVMRRGSGDADKESDGSMAILARAEDGVSVSYRSRTAMVNSADLWTDFSTDGQLDNSNDTKRSAGESIIGAISVQVELAPGESRTVPFTLAWDFPITEFGSGTQWLKRYTDFYGVTGQNAFQIAADAMNSYPEWESSIDAWQQPILEDATRPDWYKTALFNELYNLVDAGTVWVSGQPGAEALQGMGHFATMECYDYAFYNTFDVNFYSSFALAHLWPELEKSVIRDFAATIPLEDDTQVTIESNGETAVRKVTGAVPHDLGGPAEDPWNRINYYKWQDINIWKDLNSKYVLQIWRDYVFTGDRSLVVDLYPSAVEALNYLKGFDTDGDGLPDHAGVPDQTYDTWTMTGPSAYTGGLLLAALEAAMEMGKITGDTEGVAAYQAWFSLAQQSYEEKLWNGTYYDYDGSGGEVSDSIMADQLAGQWYADATGLPAIVPEDHIVSALQTIYANNVLKFGEGQMGAVNGMRPDGTVDTSDMQSQEVWTGVSYALASLMLSHGMEEEAMNTAYGVYNVTYNRGYWFRTPEAYNEDGDFRASIYMRPLSIWSMQPRPTVDLPAAYAPLPADPSILLPEPGQVLNGVFLPQNNSTFVSPIGSIEQFAADTGKYPALSLVFYDWSGSTWTKALAQINVGAEHNIAVMVGWEPRVFSQKQTLQAIIDGDEDSTIRDFAEGALAYGGPVFLRWGHEMNGTWYAWSGNDNGKDPNQYVLAWRHVYDVMVNEVGATNIIWVWCPNAYSVPNEDWNAIENYYPGDEYVDWVAVDFYGLMKDWGRTDPGPALDQVYDLFGDRKPIMIGESAAADPEHSDAAYGMSKVEWINAWFDAIEARPNVRAAVWFNIDKEADWRVQSDPESLAAFSARVADPRYLGEAAGQ